MKIKGIELNKENLKKFRKELIAVVLCAVVSMSAVFFGYTQGESGPRIAESVDVIEEQLVPMAFAPIVSNSKAEIDLEHINDGGIVRVRVLSPTDKELRVQVSGPETVYTYHLIQDTTFEVYPISDGDGEYIVRVLQQVEGSRYAALLSVPFNVNMISEFAPFLSANQYVNFTPGCATSNQAARLAGETTMETVSNIYNYILENITYDRDLAQSVRSGYVPDVNRVLAEKKGICFDYAALTTAMLRSQEIPTRLVVGYAGELYHAWIDVYVPERGWVNNVIFFDGDDWRLMDPTFAATGGQAAIQYVINTDNYHALYYY